MSQDTAALSLLSLSLVAETAPPLAVDPPSVSKPPSASAHNRRLSSTGRRRRLSDARDAATRPISVGSPIASMAAMSLSSTSPPPTSVSIAASAPSKGSTPIPIAPNGPGRKKRGVDHKCETCSKIYRHPSCLIKHRWEHTSHWRTLASLPTGGGGVLSKHAQVQLLEAAAILSHLSPDSDTGTSLPDDRGMWPRWCSGGVLEGEDGISTSYGSVPGTAESFNGYGLAARNNSGGPRLHDYEVPRGAEVRAGVVEVPHGRHGHGHSRSLGSSAWSVPRSVSVSASVSSEQSRSRSTPSDDDELEEDGPVRARGRGTARVWKHEEDDDGLGFEIDLDGVREERELEANWEEDGGKGKGRAIRESESLRWAGMQEDDIDMDLD
ncbi:hypothetical protein C8F01DRAFT_1078562 [Mycena amicta]|nr:hypothetical protein C8F01DRAFT_1078562 [Mycena amicta]